ncbi:MAG: outer membrane lipoprotein carrier protein LolA [Algisphaera sp.]
MKCTRLSLLSRQMVLAVTAAMTNVTAPTLAAPAITTPHIGEIVNGWTALEQVILAHPAPDTYRARFTQHKTSPLLRDPMVSEGVVQMSGGLARWDTQPPHATVMLLGNDELQLYYPDQETLEIYPLSDSQTADAPPQGLAAMATSPVPDLPVLREHFELTHWGWIKGNEQITLTFIPRDASMREAIETVGVIVDAKRGVLHQFTLTDLDGEVTQLTFHDIELDPDLDAKSLELTVPTNTHIIRPLDAVSAP